MYHHGGSSSNLKASLDYRVRRRWWRKRGGRSKQNTLQIVIVKEKLGELEDSGKQVILSVALRHNKVKKRMRCQLRVMEVLVYV